MSDYSTAKKRNGVLEKSSDWKRKNTPEDPPGEDTEDNLEVIFDTIIDNKQSKIRGDKPD